MPVLLLRLKGPMQSWGTQSQFLVRETGLEPSKSGVIGLLCAALGKPRHESPDTAWPTLRELAALRMAVRVDSPGKMMRDYHTTGGRRRNERYGVISADGSALSTVVSQRYYLADAAFLVGLESDSRSLLERLHRALASPVWQLYLGRKAYVPGCPVHLADGLRDESLEDAIRGYPLLVRPKEGELVSPRVVMDSLPAEASEVRHDVPVDFFARKFSVRHVRVTLLETRETEG